MSQANEKEERERGGETKGKSVCVACVEQLQKKE